MDQATSETPESAAFSAAPPSAAPVDDYDAPPPRAFANKPDKLKRGRRNPARLWLQLGIGFALAVSAVAGAIAWFGLPSWAMEWLPVSAADPDLIIELPEAEQDHRTLPNGTIYFSVHGSVVNPTDRAQRVPPIKAQLRDAQGAVVYEWIIDPPVAVLPPGERRSFTQARTDIPRRAVELTATWADPR